MRQQIDVPFLANMVAMLRADVDGALLICDDEDEARFYERSLHPSGRVLPAPGRALQVLGVAETRGVRGMAAALRGPARGTESANIFRPSQGDIASLLLTSTVCSKVLREICGTPWLTACEKELGSPRDRCIWLASIVAELRAECVAQTGRQLELGDIADLVDWPAFSPQWSAIEPLAVGQGVPTKQVAEIRSRKADYRDHDVVKCDGNEAVHLLAAATQRYHPRGLRANSIASVEGVLAMLRVAYDIAELEGEALFWSMRAWELQNPKFPLLRQWRHLDPLGVVLDQRYWEQDLGKILELEVFQEISVLKMDLDNFKVVNERLGHSGGDQAIRLYCERVGEEVEGIAVVYRRGGDELVVIAPGIASVGATALAERIRAGLETAFKTWGAERNLDPTPTASIGVITVSPGAVYADVVRELDQIQQRAKQEGKNRVIVGAL